MMRVIAGTARNLKLETPEGLDTRPTTDRIKETLFNILQSDIPGSVVIDFFSGSGALGIEALSRGAKKAYLVDNGKKAAECIVRNIKHTHFEDKAVFLKEDFLSSVYHINEAHIDIVFMDPPYASDFVRPLLLALKDKSYIGEDTLIVVESALNTSFDYVEDMGYTIFREKKYKTNKHVFLYPKKA